MKHVIVSAIGLTALVVSQTAWAYRVLEKDGKPVGWDTSTVVFDIEQTMPEGVKFERMLEQVNLAIDLWNTENTCDAPKFQFTAVRAGAGASGDGRNTIQWVHSNWAGTGQSDKATGYTDILIEKTDSAAKILETDIWLNAEGFDWTSDKDVSDLINISGTLAHEFGHALGLDHPCEFDIDDDIPVCSDDADDMTLMYPVVLPSEPQLREDDVAGLCAVYEKPECAEDGTGCLSSPEPTTPERDGAVCENDEDCETVGLCTTSACMKMPALEGDVCEENLDCESFLCVKGACREACNASHACVRGQACDEDSGACGTGTLAFGDTCKSGERCVTGLCYIDPGPETYCTRYCDVSSPCPDGYACEGNKDDRSFCVIPSPKSKGCSVSSTRSGGALWVLLGLGVLIVGRKFRTVRTGT